MSLYPGNSGTVLHGNFGYPSRGAARRIRPTVLAVVHITGNSRLPSALAEAQYSARAGSGASFTFVMNRNGTVVQCLHPESQTPWTNGDLTQPVHPVTRDMLGKPYNANEYCFLTVENVGYNPGYPITRQQIDSLAKLIAWGSKKSGLPINSNTVLGHRYFNSVGRWNCPTPGDLADFLDEIIRKANAILDPQEDIMALVPSEVLAAGTKAAFKEGVEYDLYRITAGKVERDKWTPRGDRHLTVLARMVLDGDAEHKGLLIGPSAKEGWIVSGWGAQPDLIAPADPTVELRAQIATLNERISKKDLVFDRIDANASRLTRSGKAI